MSLISILHANAIAYGEKTLYRFVNDAGKVQDTLTYQELYSQSKAIGEFLKTKMKHKENVLLVFPPGLDFIRAFFGCLMAGVVAVPVYPPDPKRLKSDIHMFAIVAKDCEATLVLTNAEYNYMKKAGEIKAMFTAGTVKWPELEWITIDGMVKKCQVKAPERELMDTCQKDDIAFLQYTSGSTANPKGVMISHGNLMHNLKLITKGLQANEQTVVVSWLPQYHDMGLIGAYLGVLYNVGTGVYMSPISFIKDTNLWLRLLSEYKATHAQAPNFAFALCARKFKKMGDLDFSSLQHFINAAEPIDATSIQNFYDALRPYGLKQGVIKPTYGLAEHTVYVCDGEEQSIIIDQDALHENDSIRIVQESGPGTKRIVSCGKPYFDEISLQIVNPKDLNALHDDQVGEIWLNSPSKAMGYYNQPALSSSTFQASMDNNSYLRTGDLGFMHDGYLYICGRLKDLIIIHGRNYYPQDIEKTIETLSSNIRPGCVAAFTTSNFPDSIQAFAEIQSSNTTPLEALGSHLKTLVSQNHGINLFSIAFISAHTIPKTTSGKISRHRCKSAFISKSIPILHQYPSTQPEETPKVTTRPAAIPDSDILQHLTSETSILLGAPLSASMQSIPLQQLGCDSITLHQLQGIISNQYTIEVPEELLYHDNTTLETLYEYIKNPATRNAVSPRAPLRNEAPARNSAPSRKRATFNCCC